MDKCEICTNDEAKYCCPKCNLKYCSLTCYRTQSHLDCTEDFYRNQIQEHLNGPNGTDNEGQRKGIEKILLRQYHTVDSAQCIDSDDDDSPLSDVTGPVDLGERLQNVNLDDTDAVWHKLNQQERHDFLNLLQSENVDKIVPYWTPWWEQDESNVEICILKIPKFHRISKKTPAPCVIYNLVNILGAYVLMARYFNGEYHNNVKSTNCFTATDCLLSLSKTLRENENFPDFQTALKSVEMECTNHSHLMEISDENVIQMYKDTKRIWFDGNKRIVLKALSDLHVLFSNCQQRQCHRKLTYLLSYVNDCC